MVVINAVVQTRSGTLRRSQATWLKGDEADVDTLYKVGEEIWEKGRRTLRPSNLMKTNARTPSRFMIRMAVSMLSALDKSENPLA